MDEIPHISFEVCVFFRKFFCEIAGGKRAGKYLLLHMWCLPTCQKSIGIDDMKLNYSEYSNRLCQNIAYFICAKKVVKVQNGFSKRKLFTWCFDEFFGSITKGHYMIVKLKSKQFLETRHAKVLSFGLWTSFSRRRINKINQFLNSVFLNWTKIWLNLQKSQIHPNEPNLSIRAPSQI